MRLIQVFRSGSFLPILFAFMQASSVRGQPVPVQQLSVTECFPELLKKVSFSHDMWRSNFALLAIVDRDTFEEARHNASLTTQFASLPWSAGYEAWDQQRAHLFQSTNVNIQQSRDTITAVSEADPQAASIISACIQAQVSRGYGLYYLPSVVDESTAFVQLFWHPTDRREELKILNSSLLNAKVVGGDAYLGRLFPKVTWFGLNMPAIKGDSITIHLIRQDPNRPISASLTTEPQVAISPIVVKPMTPPVHCTTTWETTSESGIPLKVERSETIEHVLTENNCCGRDSYWGVTLTAPGPIYNLDCHKAPDSAYWDIYLPPTVDGSGATATCKGRVNGGGGGQVYFAAFYKEQRTRCVQSSHW